MKAKVNRVVIQVIQGDIFALTVSAIVHTTNTSLALNAELAAKAGPVLQKAVETIGWCEVASAVITDPGSLPVQKIIHAVPPRWGEGSERGKLANLTLQCLQLAEENHLKSIALPALSIGTFGYPVENCAKTMLTQIIDFTFENPRYLKTIIVCLDTSSAYAIFTQELAEQIEGLKAAGDSAVVMV